MRGYINANHGQLHYRSNLHRDGTPLLLLHQSPSDSRMYDALMRELDNQYWMIAPDNPGFGNSDPLPGGFDLPGCARAIRDLLDALEIPTTHVFGHHTGATIAVQFTHDYPGRVAKLALCGPTLLSPEFKAALPARAAPFAPEADGSHLVSMWQRMSSKEKSAEPALILREVMSAFASGENYSQAYSAVTDQAFEAQLTALEHAVLVFCGTEDILYDQLEATYRCLRNGQRAEIEGAGSFICDRRPGEVAGLLGEFLGNS